MYSAAYSITDVERRGFKRVPVKYLAHINNSDGNLYATVLNISEKGIGLRSPHNFESNEILNLKVNCYYSFGDNVIEQFYIYLKTQIIWSIPERENVFLSGLRILGSYNDGIHKLKNHLQILFLHEAFHEM